MADFAFPLFRSLVNLTLFSLALSLGLRVHLRQVISLWQRPGLLNRAILGMNVMVPIVAIWIGVGMGLPAHVKIGLALVSMSPGTSLPLQYLLRTVKGRLCVEALQTTAAFLSVMTVPLTLAIANEFLPANAEIAPFAVAKQLLVVQL